MRFDFLREVLMTKNGLIDFAQSCAIYLVKIELDLWRREKEGSLCILGPSDACKRAFLTSAVAMLRYREKEADLRLS
jgi:hypothetical protein